MNAASPALAPTPTLDLSLTPVAGDVVRQACELYARVLMGDLTAIVELAELGHLRFRQRWGGSRSMDPDECERVADNCDGLAECMGFAPGQIFKATDAGLPDAARIAWQAARALEQVVKPDTAPERQPRRDLSDLDAALCAPIDNEPVPVARVIVFEQPRAASEPATGITRVSSTQVHAGEPVKAAKGKRSPKRHFRSAFEQNAGTSKAPTLVAMIQSGQLPPPAENLPSVLPDGSPPPEKPAPVRAKKAVEPEDADDAFDQADDLVPEVATERARRTARADRAPPQPLNIDAMPRVEGLVMFPCARPEVMGNLNISTRGCAGMYREANGKGAGPAGKGRDGCKGCAVGRQHAEMHP